MTIKKFNISKIKIFGGIRTTVPEITLLSNTTLKCRWLTTHPLYSRVMWADIVYNTYIFEKWHLMFVPKTIEFLGYVARDNSRITKQTRVNNKKFN